MLAGLQGNFTGEGLRLVVLIKFARNGRSRVVRRPTPFANRNKLHRSAAVPAQAWTLAANEKLVADTDVGGGEQASRAVGRRR